MSAIPQWLNINHFPSTAGDKSCALNKKGGATKRLARGIIDCAFENSENSFEQLR
jgi:hypothetical protein